MTTRPSGCGRKLRASRWTGFSVAAWPTTTGPWVSPDRAAPVRRSITTAAPSTASRVARRPTRIATSRSGISCSCRTSVVRAPRRRTSRSSARCRARTSIPVWASSASRVCCRVSTTSTKPTWCGPSSTAWQRSPRADMGRATTRMTCATASSATTPARRRSSSVTGSAPAMKAAATCCAACCAGSSAPPSCLASKSR
ncbi:Uncharacterised protein [Mycobacteroides abscessus subsp. abscessus]|nr:Uncharacterised protein [Mycobacteroides abscessus subsp. abscessus]